MTDRAHVLIVEPDRQLSRIYADCLMTRQYHVAQAATAQSAIVEADRTKPDAVILELQLTAHSGIEFLYEFRSYADWVSAPVIVLSAVPPTEFAASRQLLSKRLGVVAYYYKPQTSLQVLLHAVDNALAAGRHSSLAAPELGTSP